MSQNEQNKAATSELDYDANQNLIGFFELLLQIDRRNHPELYDRHSDPDNS